MDVNNTYDYCVCCDKEIKGTPTICTTCKTPMHYDCAFQCVKCGNPTCCTCAIKQKYTCSDCNIVETVSMEFISSTMFDAYLKCPYSFKHEYILNTIPEADRDSKYSLIGSMLHDIFEKYSKIRPLLPKHHKAIQVEFNNKFDIIPLNYFINEEDKAKFKAIHTLTVDNFFAMEQDKPIPLITEQQHFVELHDDLPKIRCTFDRINGVESIVSEWELEDYKTGKVYSSSQLQDNMQLPIYAICIKKMYGEYPKILRLIFPQHLTKKQVVQERVFKYQGSDTYVCVVKQGGTYTINVKQRLDKMIEIYSAITRNEFPCNTRNEHFCYNFCTLNKKGMCDGLNTKWQNVRRKM